jgi:N6-adenosine-specific RNA methylase IME4
MTGIQIASLRLPGAANGAQLFLWVPTRHAGDAFLLLQVWGFKYRGLFVWLKRLGLGRCIRHQVEFLLWGARPGAKLPPFAEVPVQVHEWKKPRRHSEKPAEAYALIASLSDAPRIDLFARQRRPGFEAWGLELE